MMTPAHVAASTLVWRNESTWKAAGAVVFGALLPDVTMFLFYGYQKAIGTKEQVIWSSAYFRDEWQFFFDIFNSFPVYAGLALVFYRKGWHLPFLVVASALLHVLCDFPLHNDDAIVTSCR